MCKISDLQVLRTVVYFHFFQITFTWRILHYDLYDWKIDLTYKHSHARLLQAWEGQAPTDLNWSHEFHRNNFNIEDAARPPTITKNDPHSTYQQVVFKVTQILSSVIVTSVNRRPTKVHRRKIMVAIFFIKSGLIKSISLEPGISTPAYHKSSKRKQLPGIQTLPFTMFMQDYIELGLATNFRRKII